MWFKIQKSTFTKLYYYYLRNLRNSLWVLAVNAVLMLLFFFSTKNLGTEGINAFISGFGSKISSTNYYQLFLFLSFNLTVSYLGLLIFLYLATRRLNGNIGGFLRSKRSQAEESCILLFACPINRQTIIAAKLAAFATYWGGGLDWSV
ncbi:MAG: hypothetical protein I3275_04880 [Candidatus Moeniiplasma glomeromycotorum]|nr:hypothetical protein [Candidatus Moeniiplasma glomeromycotorum]